MKPLTALSAFYFVMLLLCLFTVLNQLEPLNHSQLVMGFHFFCYTVFGITIVWPVNQIKNLQNRISF